MKIESATIINQYKIVAPIGKGGMGEVYLAQDTRLDRRVAVKFLNEGFARDSDKLNRFVREAKAASALNHPNILTVYEIGEIEGTHYIVTEFIEGQTLREHLSSGEPQPLNQILKISIQIAEALSAAHSAGIVHRDIKPDNVMIRADGYVKVLDFGLAKLVEKRDRDEVSSEGETKAFVQTNPGMVMGTVSYMSPEQARGKEIDARSDIWSSGVVLYEMLAGRLPFTGETINHTIVSILEKEPLLLESVPEELQRIVRKALTKDKEMRYQTARDLLIDLKNLRRTLDIQGELERSVIPNKADTNETGGEKATQVYAIGEAATTHGVGEAVKTKEATSVSSLEYAVTQAKSHKLTAALIGVVVFGIVSAIAYFAFFAKSSNGQIDSIAVLPFENRSGNPDSEYLSDGLAESLIYRLSQLPALKVSPSSSVFRYKGKETDAQEIGNALGVQAVMTGRIVQRGDNLTVSVELIDVRHNKLLWGEQYERKLSELLQTQREIAAEITNKLQLKLSGADARSVTKKYTDSNEAYQFYLKGRYHISRRTKDDVFKGVEYYKQAIRLDPNFALAYARLAEAYSLLPFYPYLSPNEAYPQAKAAARRALEIDPMLSEAHAILANSVTAYEWNWAEAESGFKRALELDPNNALVHFRYAMSYLLAVGRTDEALAEVNRALEIEPLDINMLSSVARIYLYDRKFDKALEQARKASEIDSNFVVGRIILGMAYNQNGLYEDAIRLGESSLQNEPTNQLMLKVAGVAYAKANRRQEAEKIINKFREIEKTQYIVSYFVAVIYAALGERDKAFAELDKGYEQRDLWLRWIKVDPFVDPLRDDPRFRDLLQRMNLPE